MKRLFYSSYIITVQKQRYQAGSYEAVEPEFPKETELVLDPYKDSAFIRFHRRKRENSNEV